MSKRRHGGKHGEEIRRAALKKLRSGWTVVEVAEEFGIHRNSVRNWVLKAERESEEASRREGLDPRDRRIEELELQIAALEGTIGKQAMELRFFKGALRRVEEKRQEREATGGPASTPKSEA